VIDLFLEVGCEPIPPQFVRSACEQLKNGILQALNKDRIKYQRCSAYFTHRRLVVSISGLPSRQDDRRIELQGPPETQAFSSDGKPTRVLKGFLKSKGMKLKDVQVRKTDKGNYVFITLTEKGQTTKEILALKIPEVLSRIEFEKAMVWNESRVSFIRPIRWICALLGGKVCPIDFAGIKSNNKTRGLLVNEKPITVNSEREYGEILKREGIIFDQDKRRRTIEKKIKQKARSLKAEPIISEAFLERITNMVESPQVAVGTFQREFLSLPKPVLERAIREIQFCIPLKRGKNLINRYIVILDARKEALKNSVRGYNQVLKASLADAQFYYENDLKIGLEKMVEMEKSVVWLEGKGTLREKTDRLVEIVKWIGKELKLETEPLMRAAYLSKADLVSNLIREKDFTPLEGIAGSFYARARGESKKIYQAIREQYLPRFIGDLLPATMAGSILSIADSLDSIFAAFAVGKKPTGSQDPMAVRKQAYGLVQIMVKQKITTSIPDLVRMMEGFYPEVEDQEIIGFFTERIRRYLFDQGIDYDIIDAVTDVCLEPYDALLRCQAMVELRQKKGFETVVIGQKRLANILKGIKDPGEPDPAIFKDAGEIRLYELTKATDEKITEPLRTRNYHRVLNSLLAMRNTIDRFFDEVLVMHEDQALRRNRLALVNYVRKIFNRFANLSKVVIPGSGDAQG